MGNEANRELMDRYFDAWRSGRRETLGDCYADDLVFHHLGAGPLSGTFHGKEAFFEVVGRIYEAAPTAEIVEVHDSFVSDRHAVALVRERFANGEDVVETNRVVVYELQNGAIAEIWTYDDDQAAVASFYERNAH